MWRQSRKYVKAVLNLITAVVILLFVVLVVPSVISYFMPFVIGWIIAMIANPLVRFLDEKIKIRRKAGSAIVIIAVIAAIVAGIYGILSLLAGQLKGFVEELPGLWKAMESDISNAGSSLESFSHYFSPNVQEQVARILNSLMNLLSSAVDHMGSPTVSAVGNFAKNIPTIIVGVIMCLLSSYFFVAQREEVIAAFRRYVPENFRKKWDVMYHSLTGAIGGYFKAQLKIEIWVYLLMLVGFLILRVRYGALISIGIGTAVYFLVIRKALMDQAGRYINVWPVWLDLENLIYRPVLRLLILLAAICCRVLDCLVDFLVVLLRRSIYRDSPLPHELPEGNVLTVTAGRAANMFGWLGNHTWRRKHPVERDYVHVLAVRYEELKENNMVIGRSLSFALLLLCIGFLLTLFYLIWW